MASRQFEVVREEMIEKLRLFYHDVIVDIRKRFTDKLLEAVLERQQSADSIAERMQRITDQMMIEYRRDIEAAEIQVKETLARNFNIKSSSLDDSMAEIRDRHIQNRVRLLEDGDREFAERTVVQLQDKSSLLLFERQLELFIVKCHNHIDDVECRMKYGEEVCLLLVSSIDSRIGEVHEDDRKLWVASHRCGMQKVYDAALEHAQSEIREMEVMLSICFTCIDQPVCTH